MEELAVSGPTRRGVKWPIADARKSDSVSPMQFFASLPETISELSARDWTNFIGFLLTPAVCSWHFPTRRAFLAIFASSMLFCIGVCIWTRQSLDFIIGFGFVVGVVLAALCAAVMFIRRLILGALDTQKSA